MIFFFLESSELAKERVKDRVQKGGHNIPAEVIDRRFHRGLSNFLNIYKNLCDIWLLYNNSEGIPATIARMTRNELSVEHSGIWERLKETYEQR